MNLIFFLLIFIAFFYTAYQQVLWVPESLDALSPMHLLTEGMIESAQGSVSLALGLVGVMAFFLGLMKVAEAGGLLQMIAKALKPLMIRLFPDVPSDHPAMGAMILNISANAMGLGNAATPFGLRAMQELDRLNAHKGTASNAMVLFLAINTSSVTLLPTGVIALRAAAGSHDPAGIVATTLIATLCSTTVAIVAAKFFARFSPLPESESALEEGHPSSVDAPPEAAGSKVPNRLKASLPLLGLLLLVPLFVLFGKVVGPWVVPSLTVLLLGFGVLRKVRIYEVFVEGAKDGFDVALKIIPFLVAILVAVGMFRQSGAMGVVIDFIGPFTAQFGLPAEVLPMALMRPLSGSGAYGLMAEMLNNPAIGPDSYIGFLVSTLQGSTETTFYVLAVYFGAVQIRRSRHALAAGLTADLAGIIGAVVACRYFYG